MQKIDDIFPNVGTIPAMIIVVVIGIALQLSGVWMLMLMAGGFGGLFTRRHRYSFIAGFVGVAIAWTGIFLYLIITAQALAIAEFFISLLGISGGALVIIISVILGGLLGGFGGLLGRSLIELIDELIPTGSSGGQPAAESSATPEASDSS
jgi:hypothetical protein